MIIKSTLKSAERTGNTPSGNAVWKLTTLGGTVYTAPDTDFGAQLGGRMEADEHTWIDRRVKIELNDAGKAIGMTVGQPCSGWIEGVHNEYE